jgi:carbonic anhydrase
LAWRRRLANLSAMVVMDEVLARNAALVATRPPPSSPISSRPRLRLAVVACMDARIDVNRALGLQEGDAHVLRNAGGLVTDDVLRSLVLSQQLLGTVEVMVVQHSDCGVHGLIDDELAGRLTAHAGQAPPFAFGGFADLDVSVRHGIERIRACPWLTTVDFVRGFVYEVETGKLREVV